MANEYITRVHFRVSYLVGNRIDGNFFGGGDEYFTLVMYREAGTYCFESRQLISNVLSADYVERS